MTQLVRDPLVVARRHVEQLGGDALGGVAVGVELARRAQVHELALAGRDVGVDRLAHERVDEAERLLGAEDLGVDVLRDRVGDRLLVQSR